MAKTAEKITILLGALFMIGIANAYPILSDTLFAMDGAQITNASYLSIDANTNAGTTVNETQGGAIHIGNTGNNDGAFTIYTNTASETSPLAQIISDNTGFSQTLLYIRGDGNGDLLNLDMDGDSRALYISSVSNNNPALLINRAGDGGGIDIDLTAAATSGTIINADWSGAATFDGAITGIDIDMTTNTVGNSQTFKGIVVDVPSSGIGAGSRVWSFLRGGSEVFYMHPGGEGGFLGNVDMIIDTAGNDPGIEIKADVFPTGTVTKIYYPTAETLTGDIIGLEINLNDNVTPDGNEETALKLEVGSTGVHMNLEGNSTVASPNHGDIWTNGSHILVHLAGSTKVLSFDS